jgi:hypothetical protein
MPVPPCRLWASLDVAVFTSTRSNVYGPAVRADELARTTLFIAASIHNVNLKWIAYLPIPVKHASCRTWVTDNLINLLLPHLFFPDNSIENPVVRLGLVAGEPGKPPVE